MVGLELVSICHWKIVSNVDVGFCTWANDVKNVTIEKCLVSWKNRSISLCLGSSQGVQLLVALILLFFVSIVSLIISVHRRSTWVDWNRDFHWLSHRFIFRSKRTTELEFLRTSTLNEKIHWDSRSSSLSKSESIRIVLILLAIVLTGISCVVIIHTRDHVREHLIKFNRLFQSCYLYENNYYWNLLTLPMALVILLILIFTKTRSEQKSYSIYIPIPFDSFSKVNRFDTMILCGLISLEIFSMIDEILFQSKSIRTLTLHGPLFDIIRQVGLIIIIGLRYYPIYAVVELNDRNLLYDGLCAFYLWFNFGLKLFEQILCTDNRLMVRIWQKLIQTNQWVTSTSALNLQNDEDIYRPVQRLQSTTTSSLTHVSSKILRKSKQKFFCRWFFSFRRSIGRRLRSICRPLLIRTIHVQRSISSVWTVRLSTFWNTRRIIPVWFIWVYA